MDDAESRLGIELIVHIADEEQIGRLYFDGRERGHANSLVFLLIGRVKQMAPASAFNESSRPQ
jgi:hypothetical protein